MAELRIFYRDGQRVKISKTLDILKHIEKKDGLTSLTLQ